MNKSNAVESCNVCVLGTWNESDMMMDEVDADCLNLGINTKSKPDDAKSSPGQCKISSDTKSNSRCHISVWCSQGIVLLRDLGAQVNSRCSWISA